MVVFVWIRVGECDRKYVSVLNLDEIVESIARHTIQSCARGKTYFKLEQMVGNDQVTCYINDTYSTKTQERERQR